MRASSSVSMALIASMWARIIRARKAWCSAKRPGQRLGQGTDLDAQPAPGQLGQRRRVAFAGDQRLEHRPPGLAEDVTGHHGELDAGVFEQLLHVLLLAAAVAEQDGPSAGEIA